MKRIVLDFWLSRGTLSVLTLVFLSLVCIIAAMLMIQRQDYRHVNAQQLEQIRAEIRSIKAQNERSVQDRTEIRRDIEDVRKAVEK